MVKPTIMGVGLHMYDLTELDLSKVETWPPEESEAFRRESRDPEAARKELEVELRQVLNAAGISDPAVVFSPTFFIDHAHELDRFKHSGESLEFLARMWLAALHLLNLEREKVAAGSHDEQTIRSLIRWAEQLGRMEERIWWRIRPVPGTETAASRGKSPEQLAAERRPQREALLQRNEGRDEENELRSEDAARWRLEAQTLADLHWRKRPDRKKADVASEIRRTFEWEWQAEERRAKAANETYRKRHVPSTALIARSIKKPRKLK